MIDVNQVDYDERCCEVLSGGNTYLRVSYDYDLLQAIDANYSNIIINKFNLRMLKDDMNIIFLTDEYYIRKDGFRNIYVIKSNSYWNVIYCWRLENIASQLLNAGILQDVLNY